MMSKTFAAVALVCFGVLLIGFASYSLYIDYRSVGKYAFIDFGASWLAVAALALGLWLIVAALRDLLFKAGTERMTRADVRLRRLAKWNLIAIALSAAGTVACYVTLGVRPITWFYYEIMLVVSILFPAVLSIAHLCRRRSD